MPRKGRFALWLPVLLPIFAILFFLVAVAVAAVLRTPTALVGCLGVACFCLLASLAALKSRAMLGCGLFFLPAIFLFVVRILEPAWMTSHWLFGSTALGLICIGLLDVLLNLENV